MKNRKIILPDNIEITIIIIIIGEEVAAEEVEREAEADPFMKLKNLLNNSMKKLLKKHSLRTPPRTQILHHPLKRRS